MGHGAGDRLEAFRRHIREWIASSSPPGLADLVDWYAPHLGAVVAARDEASRHPSFQLWERCLLEQGLVCPSWPEEAGGRGLSPLEVAVFNQELCRAGVPGVHRGMGESLVGPAVIAHGTAEQRLRFLPRIISGEDRYCQGFSEPDHGSDLAGIETRAEIQGDEIVMTGTKVWTSKAAQANMMFVLCRTNSDVPPHAGLSYVLAPISNAGLEISPIRDMAGSEYFYMEHLDGFRAPLANVIGGLDNGWRVAMTTLANERGGHATVQHVAYEREFWDLVEESRRRSRNHDPVLRQRLAAAYCDVQIMRFEGLRLLATIAQDRIPGPEASVSKLFWSEYHQRLTDLAMDILGPGATVGPPGPGYQKNRWQDMFLWSRAGSIYSGTNEVQRNIVAERALGLPKGR